MEKHHSSLQELPIDVDGKYYQIQHKQHNNLTNVAIRYLPSLLLVTSIIITFVLLNGAPFRSTNNNPSYLLPNGVSNSSSPVVLPSSITSPVSSSSSSRDAVVDEGLRVSLAPSSTTDQNKQKCDLFTGKWVWDEENAPYYTNATCSAIHEQQNCIKYEKPNLDFTKWRWKPNECELPIFDPVEFLELLRGKSLAFIGDSVGRNQFASLVCLLAKVGYPEDHSYSPDPQTKRVVYTNYNFTLSLFWSPYLVKTKENGPSNSGAPLNIYLDEFDVEWTSQIEYHDYIILSAGHWFFRPAMFYESGKLVGCLYCDDDNVKHFDPTYGYGRAFATSFRAVNSLENFKGIAFLRTFSPSHFEGGSWNEGGNCLKTKPFLSNETQLHDQDLKMYTTQLEEFKVAEREGLKKNSGVVNNFRLLDTTQMLWLRPDGHPSSYWHTKGEVGKYNDCVHWCLPGPIDTSNDILFEMLKIETN
ncbi:hypothetical protein C5167_033472 [Papaver somniferum]|uniref:Uncharacterized protein n=1 Tax=Papaver somniferum TaxID=3469 RepID=A0A4Y7KEJ7_PAPSO|nr:protein trichome birefringence-like 19 [Papaver somniferum]RZC70335.1 hypothetical protein C5167_033472 [Papaver somniferum]